MSGNHNSTRNNNVDLLTNELKLSQFRNSTIFTNDKYFVLSPSVQNGKNWFDLRKINLDRKPSKKEGLLLIRMLNDFILVDLNKIISELCDSEPYETKNSGIHWKFQIRKSESSKEYIFNTKSKKRIDVERSDRKQILSKIK